MTTDPNAHAAAAAEAARKRKLRRRHKRERQAVIFGAVLAGLATVGLGAAAIWTGSMESPVTREFTTIEPSPSTDVTAPPCVPADTLPVPYGQITINVFNATSRPGLAGSTADLLGQRGFEIATTDNYGLRLRGATRIGFGAQGVAQAYTVAAHFPEVELVYDERTDAVVDVALGGSFEELVPLDSVPLVTDEPMTGVAGCVPLADAVPAPAPAPVSNGDTEDGDDTAADDDAAGDADTDGE